MSDYGDDDSWIDGHLESDYEDRNGGDVITDPGEFDGWEPDEYCPHCGLDPVDCNCFRESAVVHHSKEKTQ